MRMAITRDNGDDDDNDVDDDDNNDNIANVCGRNTRRSPLSPGIKPDVSFSLFP